MSDAILILGMHRSGTSAITGAIAKMGATLPSGLMPADSGNERGYFEPERLVKFNDRLLSLGGSSWFDWTKFEPRWITSPPTALVEEAEKLIFDEFGNAPLFVIKEPRMCRLIPFWRSVFENLDIRPRVVIPFRSPYEVALSLQARHNLSFQRGLLLWMRHVIDAERDSRDWPRCFVPMDDFLEDWRNWIRRIALAIGVAWPKLDDETCIEIDQFLSPELKHYNVELTYEGPGAGWVAPLYESLLLLAQSSNSSLASIALGEVAKAFETACNLIAPDFVSLEASNTQLHKEIAALVEARPVTFAKQRPQSGMRVQQRREESSYSMLDKYSDLRARTGEVRGALEEVRAALTKTQ